jgi:hypothetical protein
VRGADVSDSIPLSTDRMPLNLRDKRAGPILDPEEAIEISLLDVWEKVVYEELNRSDAAKIIVRAIDMAGYKIVPK